MGMTAKEKLRQTVEELSEAEAQDALGFIVRRQGKRDALAKLLERAPLDDEPTTPEEDEGAREAKEQIVRGDVLSAPRTPSLRVIWVRRLDLGYSSHNPARPGFCVLPTCYPSAPSSRSNPKLMQQASDPLSAGRSDATFRP